MKKTLQLEGLDCAACAAELEEEIAKTEGVSAASVSFMTQKLTVECDSEKTLAAVKEKANGFEDVKVVETRSLKKTLLLQGLDCAACAAELEEEIAATEGVIAASVSFVHQKLTVECDSEKTLSVVKEKANHFENVKVAEEIAAAESGKRADGKILLRLENLHCAACAMDLEDELKKIKGVKEVQVDFITQSILLDAENDDAVRKVIRAAGRFEKVKVLDGDKAVAKKETHLKEILQIVVAALFFAPGFILEHFIDGKAAQIASYVLFAVAYFTVGYPVLISTAKNIAKGKIFDENFLMTVASLGAVCLKEFGEGVAVMLLYQLGELLQGIAVGASRRSVSDLMDLKSETATLLDDGEQKSVSPESLKIGDIVLVKAGEKVPADGVLLSKTASLDTKSLTGESALRDVGEGGELLSGCINAGGVFEMKIARAYEDSAVAKILDLVENSSSKKAAPEKFITKFAKYYTPVVCCLAAAIALIVPVVLGLANGGGYGGYFRRWINTALNFLVISCPCALIISVPLTYFSGIGSCARNGILVKGATYLDTAAKVRAIAFDKTGTLTEGNFAVCGTFPAEGIGKAELLAIAAAAEKGSSHPIAKAFEGVETGYRAENVREVAGRGVSAEIGGKNVLVGNAALLKENGIAAPEADSAYTQIYTALDGKYLGRVEIGDRLRPEARDAILELKSLGIQRTVMLTGDSRARAEKIADEVGMSEVNAQLLPDEKLEKAELLKKDGALLYVGDGINDAPVMAVADCSVSMGKLGSAAAVEASDLVLISDNLRAIPRCVRIARKTRKIVTENIAFSIAMKVAFMALGVAGVMPLWLAVFADVGVMLLAVLNSLRMRLKIRGEGV